MRFALMSEPQQGLSYVEILALARTAEEAGFESYFRSDHYASFPGADDQPTTDAWATLAGLARDTSHITLGTLVSPVTFRQAGNLVKVATTVDEMSGGRVEVGVGAGWNDEEHAAYGLPFPEQQARFDMLEEQLAIIHGLWTQPDGWSYEGHYWQVRNARFYPKPQERAGHPHPNLIVGGKGGPRLARLVAQYADEINISSASSATVAEGFGRVRDACSDIGRDPSSVTYSAMTGVLVGRDESEVRARVRDLIPMFGGSDDGLDAWLSDRRQRWIMGTPDEARQRVNEFEAAGVERLMLQTFVPRDLEMVRLLGEIFGLRAGA
jgi:F420-dependent oxidoreductase-like protein